jgi:hypothetical protein
MFELYLKKKNLKRCHLVKNNMEFFNNLAREGL